MDRLLFKLLLFAMLVVPLGSEASVRDGKVRLPVSQLQDQAVELKGFWKFTMNSESRFIHVPDSWTFRDLPRFGVGIYELELEFDQDPGPLTLWTEYVATEFKVFVDGRQVYGPQQFERDPDQVWVGIPRYIPLPVQGRQLKLRIEVSNQVDVVGGLLRPVWIGRAEHVVKLGLQRKYAYASLITVYTFLLLCFAFLGLQADDRERSLNLARLCFSLMISFALPLYASFGHSWPWGLYIRLNDLGWIGFSYFFSVCCITSFNIKVPGFFTSLVQKIPWIALPIVLFWQQSMRPALLILLYAYTVICIITVLTSAVQTLRLGHRGSLLFVMTLFLLILAFVNDTLNSLGLLGTYYVIGHFFIVYLLVQAWLVAQQRRERVMDLERQQFAQLEKALTQQLTGFQGLQEFRGSGYELRASCSQKQTAAGYWLMVVDRGRYLLFFLAQIKGDSSGSMLTQIALSYSLGAVLDVQDQNSVDHAETLLSHCTQAARRAVHDLADVLGHHVVMSLSCWDKEKGFLFHVAAGELALFRQEGDACLRVDISQPHLGDDISHRYSVQEIPLNKGGCLILPCGDIDLRDERAVFVELKAL